MTPSRLLVLATGGTIAGRAGSATRRDYRAGQIGIESFLADVDALGLTAALEGRQIANIDSADIGPAIWRKLHTACTEAMDDPGCDGVIITHGSDTAEETAFLLDLTLPATKPVVLVGAMRAADAVGADGLRNFANAVAVASNPDAAGRGVLLVMGDEVLAARDARKARTSGAHAFASYPRGPAALVTPASLEWLERPWRTGEAARYAFPEKFPLVPIVHAYAGITSDALAAIVTSGTRAIVIAGFGDGNLPDDLRSALAETAASGIPVVRASRVDEGLVDRQPDDLANGFVAARALGPAKARILLQLLLASGITDPAAIQNAFGRR